VPMMTNALALFQEGHPVEPEIQAERPKITHDTSCEETRLFAGGLFTWARQRRLITGGHYKPSQRAASMAGEDAMGKG